MPKIIVKSTVDGFRRGGHAFTREGRVLDTSELSKAQLQAITSEKKLVVSDYAEPKSDKPQTAAEKKAAAEKAAADQAAADKKAAEDAAKAQGNQGGAK